MREFNEKLDRIIDQWARGKNHEISLGSGYFSPHALRLTPSPTGNALLERPAPEPAPAAASPLLEGEQETRKAKPKIFPRPQQRKYRPART